MRRIRDFVAQNAMDDALRKSLRKALPLLSWKVERGQSRDNNFYIEFWAEWVCLVTALWQHTSAAEWDEDVRSPLWTALESVINGQGYHSETRIHHHLILDFFKLIVIDSGGGGLSDLEKHPKLLEHMSTHLTVAIAGPDSMKWLDLLFDNRNRLFCSQTEALQDLWIQNGLDSQILNLLKASRTRDHVYRALTILEDIAVSPTRNEKIIRSGFIKAIVEVMLQINKLQASFDKNWQMWERFALEATLSMWKRAKGKLGLSWPTDEFLFAVNPALTRLTQSMALKPIQDVAELQAPKLHIPGSLDRSDGRQHSYDALITFISDIKGCRSQASLISRGFDVAMNRLCDLMKQPLEWNYALYANLPDPLPCSRPIHSYDTLL